MEAIINNKTYNVFITKKHIKRMYLRVKSDGIYISCNYLVSEKMIKTFIENNSDFIEKTYLKEIKKEKKKEEFYYLGNKYDIIVLNTVSKIEIYNDRIFVKNKEYLNTFLKNECKRVFTERLEYCYNLFEEDIVFPKLKIGHMTRKWGYCNNKNEIKLNSELIKYSVNEIDYVIIHELSHLIEFNHSKRFWNIVKKYKSDYKECMKVLKEE